MKKTLAIVAVLVIAAVAAYFMLQNPLGRLVKMAVEEFGPEMTQATVKVGKVEISATDGHGALSGLFLGNPKRFESDYVKGCRIPALNRRLIRMQQNAPGRRRTSLEGRNRVMLPVRVEQEMLYGDLNYRSAV